MTAGIAGGTIGGYQKAVGRREELRGWPQRAGIRGGGWGQGIISEGNCWGQRRWMMTAGDCQK